MDENELAGVVIGAAIDVHKVLGPGLLESAYQDCLVHELTLRGVALESEVPVAVEYKGLVDKFQHGLTEKRCVPGRKSTMKTLRPLRLCILSVKYGI